MTRAQSRESALVRQCLQYLALQGVFAWRNNNAGIVRTDGKGRKFWQFSGQKGAADILGVLKGGRLLAVECKIKPNKPSKDQAYFLERVNEAGGLGICVYDVADLIKVMEGE